MIIARYAQKGEEITGTFPDSDLETVKKLDLLTPVRPGKIVAVGLNYLDHIKEFGDRQVPSVPVLFVKLPHTVIGPGKPILLPEGSMRVDYEAELAVVIGAHCFRVTTEEAEKYILGFTCANDVTERNIQKTDGQWTRAKNYPSFCPLGPYILTDFQWSGRWIRTVLNGKTVQESNLDRLLWNPWQLVSFISQSIPLEENDVILTGTPAGVGPMRDGDLVEVKIEGLGTLANPVRKRSEGQTDRPS